MDNIFVNSSIQMILRLFLSPFHCYTFRETHYSQVCLLATQKGGLERTMSLFLFLPPTILFSASLFDFPTAASGNRFCAGEALTWVPQTICLPLSCHGGIPKHTGRRGLMKRQCFAASSAAECFYSPDWRQSWVVTCQCHTQATDDLVNSSS